MSFSFNTDFESNLFKESGYRVCSNKINQEFEYLFFFVEKSKDLYSTKVYNSVYKDYVESLTNDKMLTTSSKDQEVKPWWGNFEQVSIKRKLQSKTETLKYGIANQLGHERTSIVSSPEKLIPGICKFPYSMSGRGHYLYPKDKDLIIKRMEKGEACINEPLLNRVLDLSTFFLDGKALYTYQNEIDSFFQYKGTWINHFSIQKTNMDKYKSALDKILEFIMFLGYKGEGSIDSFFFEEKGEIKLYALSEINARKTMGSIAHQIYEKYFSHFLCGKFGLVKRNRDVDYIKILERFNQSAWVLSPNNNLFHTYFIGGNCKKDILEKEELLLTLL